MSKPRIKLLHVITNLQTGGAEVMLHRLLQAGSRDRFEREVVSLMDPDPGDGGTIAPKVAALGVPLSNLGMRRALPRPHHVWRLRRAARTANPNLLQGWMYHGNLAASYASWVLAPRVPVIWNVRHSVHDLSLEKRLTRAVIRSSVPLSHHPRAIIYNARVSAVQHERLGFAPDRTVVIPNGFDGELFRPQPDARPELCALLGLDPDAVIVGMIARDHPMKDPGNLIRAVAALVAQGQRIALVIAGRGLDRGNRSLVEQVGAAALGDHVRLLGERPDVPRVVAGFDVAVLPSAWGEGFPNVIGEAMASGVPCVATDVGDSGWIIGPHGIVVPPRQPEALAAALASLIELGAAGRRQLGAGARVRILEKFALPEVVRQYEALHERFGRPLAPDRTSDPLAEPMGAPIRRPHLADDRWPG